MAKFLLVIVVVAVVLWLMFGRRGSRGSGGRNGPPRAEGMVRCAHCGVHLPRSEAVLLGDRVYCSPAHRDLGARE
jgi:uncharacterized protein